MTNSCIGSCRENVPAQKAVSSNLQSTDGLARIEIVAHYEQHFTMKPVDPMQLTDVTLHCEMYPAGKVDISQHLAIPGFPKSDHTVGKPSADAGSQCSKA